MDQSATPAPIEAWMNNGELVEVDGKTYYLSLSRERQACHIGRWEAGAQPGSGTVRTPKTLAVFVDHVFGWHPYAVVRWALAALARAGRPIN